MFEKDYNLVNLNNELNDAVIEGNISKVKELFELEDPPFVDHEINGVALIMYAAQKANWDLVEVLYNQEANLDVMVPYLDWYLIHECIKNAPDRVTKAVMEYSNINVQTKSGLTPLMVAIKEGKSEMASHIIDVGLSDLSIVDKNLDNAAHIAAKTNNLELFLKLSEKGCPLNKENKEGQTPIDCIEDISFKENFVKILNTRVTNKHSETEVKSSVEEVIEQTTSPKVTGLSKIKRR